MSQATQSQNKAILERLEIGGEMEPVFALKHFKCMRLAARIYDINKQLEPAGRRVKSKMLYYKTFKGVKKKYKLYWLEPLENLKK